MESSSQKDYDPPSKKTKVTPLKQIIVGETMIDIKLRIVTSDAIRELTNNKVWTIVGSDGFDFVNITMWGPSVDRLARELGPDFLAKTFALRNFSAYTAVENFNYGNLPIELRAKESSTFTQIKTNDHAISGGDLHSYYRFLRVQHALDEATFHPIPLSNVQKDQTNIDIEAELNKIKQLRIVPVKGHDCRVLDAEIIEGKTKGSFTAWNIYAEFLEELLQEKEGCKIKIQNTTSKRIAPDVNIVFTKNTKILLIEKAENEPKAIKISDLGAKRGLCLMEVHARIGKKQMAQNRKFDGTIIHDGTNKAQLLFPNSLKFQLGDEITILSGTVSRNDGVTTLTVHNENDIIRKRTKKIQEQDISELPYPD